MDEGPHAASRPSRRHAGRRRRRSPAAGRRWPWCPCRGSETRAVRAGRSARASTRLATYRPSCMATGATPGRSSTATMSPTTKHLGVAGQAQVRFGQEAADTVAGGGGGRRQGVGRRRRPHPGRPDDRARRQHSLGPVGLWRRRARTVMPPTSMSTASVSVRISTPSARRSRGRPAAQRLGGNRGRMVGPASIRITCASRVETLRKSLGRTRCARVAISPVSSTPVGPAPTTTKVSQARAFVGARRRARPSRRRRGCGCAASARLRAT